MLAPTSRSLRVGASFAISLRKCAQHAQLLSLSRYLGLSTPCACNLMSDMGPWAKIRWPWDMCDYTFGCAKAPQTVRKQDLTEGRVAACLSNHALDQIACFTWYPRTSCLPLSWLPQCSHAHDQAANTILAATKLDHEFASPMGQEAPKTMSDIHMPLQSCKTVCKCMCLLASSCRLWCCELEFCYNATKLPFPYLRLYCGLAADIAGRYSPQSNFQRSHPISTSNIHMI